MKPDDAASNPRAAPTGSTSPPTSARGPTTPTPSRTSRAPRPAPPTARTWYDDFGSVRGRLRRCGHRGPAEPRRARPASPTSRSPASSPRSTPAPPPCKAAGADVVVMLVHEGAADDHAAPASPTTARFGGSSRASTPTSTRSSPATPTWPTTAPYSGRPGGLGRAVRHGTSTSCCSRSTRTRPARSPRSRRTSGTVKAQTTPVRGELPRGPGRHRPSSTTPWPRADVLGRSSSASSPVRSTGPSSPTAPPRTAAASPPSATSSPRCSAGRPDARGRRRTDRLHEPGRPARRTWWATPGGYPATLTYKQAAVVQPFANTLVNMKLTGAQIKTVLEQQWQRDGEGAVPSRPFLRLGTSAGLLRHLRPHAARGQPRHRHVAQRQGHRRRDAVLRHGRTRSSPRGGDNFRGFNAGTEQARHRQGRPAGDGRLHGRLRHDDAAARQHASSSHVGISWPADAPRFYRIGQDFKVNLSSLAMTGPGDAKDATLDIKVGDVKREPGEGRQHRRHHPVRRERQECGVGSG